MPVPLRSPESRGDNCGVQAKAAPPALGKGHAHAEPKALVHPQLIAATSSLEVKINESIERRSVIRLHELARKWSLSSAVAAAQRASGHSVTAAGVAMNC